VIKIYNSQTKNKEVFNPLNKGIVNMYVCGPTVYDLLHVGNFRGAIFFNLVFNFLKQQGYQVNFAYNFTDVDDKIIKKALDINQNALSVSEHFIQEFKKDFHSLKLTSHTFNPKVSEYIPQMINYVEKIIANNMAYTTSDGSVYLRRHKLPSVGILSGRDISESLTGDKNFETEKEHESDFALWKGVKDGEISWPSPWGNGRPGWHLECSVMINEIFQGQTLDIHGGGLDLLFPHHENECNQCSAFGQKKLSNIWMHNQMLNMGNQKMSKSLGNVQTGRDFIATHSGEVLKFIILSHHYRSIIDFSPKQIEILTNQLAKIYQTLRKAQLSIQNPDNKHFDNLFVKSQEALQDDFNTPVVFSYIYEAISEFNKNPKLASSLIKFLKEDLGSLLSLFNEDPISYTKYLDGKLLKKIGLTEAEIEVLIQKRNDYRKNKNYSESDRIRKELNERQINLLDYPSGTIWELIRTLF
jgi:cysteinyl-tRNA synthetase